MVAALRRPCVASLAAPAAASSDACPSSASGTGARTRRSAGSSAALSCPAGRFGNVSGLAAEGECHACPPDSFCFTGAEQPMPCSPGTHAPQHV